MKLVFTGLVIIHYFLIRTFETPKKFLSMSKFVEKSSLTNKKNILKLGDFKTLKVCTLGCKAGSACRVCSLVNSMKGEMN